MEVFSRINKISSFLLEDKYRGVRHLLLQVVILMISLGIFFDAPDRINVSLNRFYGWISYYLFMNMLVYFTMYVLFPRFLAKNKFFSYMLSVGLFTFFALLIMLVLQELFYDIGVTHQQPDGITLFFRIASSLLSIFLFVGGVSAVLFFKHWMLGNRRIDNLNKATTESELKFLKSQINPHFLFNMLNNANILVDDDPDMASHILVKLDDLLQYQLNDSTKEQVSLYDDIHFLEDYLELEKMRRDNFYYKVEIKNPFEDIKIPPLLFIPFVENAVKHNGTNNGSSYIHLSFDVRENILLFTCENSVSSVVDLPKKDGGLGLTNIRKRLELLFENNYSLEQTRTDTKYLVKLRLTL